MSESAKTMGDEEFEDLARALREGAGRELRDEAAADELEAEKQRRRRMDLSDPVRLAMHRGDKVTVSTAGLTLSDPVVAVGDDYLIMESPDRTTDISLHDATVTVVPTTTGGRTGRPQSKTLAARLREHEQRATSVELFTRSGAGVRGRVEVVT